jgi:hypothetical protein
VPELHRYIAGGTAGGPIIKNKLFGFIGYQHLHVSDQEIGYSRFSVPVGLSDDRGTDGLAAVANAGWCPQPDPSQPNYDCPLGSPLQKQNLNNNAVNPGSSVASNLFNQPAVKGEAGSWLIPNPTGVSTVTHPYNVSLPGTAYFIADQLVADVDWNASPKDTLALKYYYQHDPTTAPYAFSNVPGWTQHLASPRPWARFAKKSTRPTSNPSDPMRLASTIWVLLIIPAFRSSIFWAAIRRRAPRSRP